jgi:hypothetical protein
MFLYLCGAMNRVRGFAERLLLVGALGAAYLVSGCKKKEKDHSHGDSQNPSDSAWVEIAHEHSPRDAHVHVYALLHGSQNGQVYEGYNRFRIKVEGYSGTNVKLVPIMYMSSHSHSCPTKQPDGRAADGYFYAETFFQMPTTVVNGTVTEPWKLHVILGENDTATAEVRVNPHPNGWVRRKSFNTSMGQVRLMYEFRPEGAFKVGTVPVRMYVYRRNMNIPHENPDGFPPASDMVQVVQLNTWMPSMGHSAEGNQPAQPLAGSFGLYRGQLGFNMSGDWDIYLAFIHQHGNSLDTLGMDTIQVRF